MKVMVKEQKAERKPELEQSEGPIIPEIKPCRIEKSVEIKKAHIERSGEKEQFLTEKEEKMIGEAGKVIQKKKKFKENQNQPLQEVDDFFLKHEILKIKNNKLNTI